MKQKSKSLLTLLLALLMIVQLGMVGASADNSGIDTSASVNAAAVIYQTADDGSRSLVPFEEYGFSVSFGNGSDSAAVYELQNNGIDVTVPAGYAIKGIYLVGDGNSFDENYSPSLTRVAKARIDGASVRLPAEIFGTYYYSDQISEVFIGYASHYTLQVLLERITAENGVITYLPGSVGYVVSPLVNGGDTFYYPTNGSTTHTIRSLAEGVADTLRSQYGKELTGWKITFANGSTCESPSGYELTAYADCTIEAQWTDAAPVEPEPYVEPDPVIRDLTIYVDSFSVDYDGNPHSGSSFTTYGLLDGDLVSATVTGTATEPGDYMIDIDPLSIYITRNGADVTGEYQIATVPGTMTISAPAPVIRDLTIYVDSFSVDYDGNPHSGSSFTPYGLLDGDLVSATVTGTATEPGDYMIDIDPLSIYITRNGADVTGEYQIATVPGTMTISAPAPVIRDLTLFADSFSVPYDGNPHSGSEFTSAGLLEGDFVFATVTGTGTEPGDYQLDVDPASVSITRYGTDVTGEYQISYVPGTMTIYAKPSITITAKSLSKYYDGEPLYAEGYEVSEGLLAGDELSVTVGGSVTSGTAAAVVGNYYITRNGMDVTSEYNVMTVDGTLTVYDTSALSITAKSASKFYDGTPLTADGYDIIGELVSGDEVQVSVSGSQTEIGSTSSIVDSVAVYRAGVDVTEQYSIETFSGTLTVSGRNPITIHPIQVSKIYDGTPLYANQWEIVSGNLITAEDEIHAEVTGTLNAPGTGVSSVVVTSITRNGADVTDEYDITCEDGVMSMTSRIFLKVKPKDVQAYADGTGVSATEVEIVEGELASGDTISATFFGTYSTAGIFESTIQDFSIMRDGVDVRYTDYDVSFLPGKIELLQRTKIAFRPEPVEKEFDGTPLNASSYTIEGGALADTDTVEIEYYGSQTAIGSSDSSIASLKILRDGNDVTDLYYEVERRTSTITVKEPSQKTALTVKPADASKDYDGIGLVASAYDIVSGTLTEGDKLVLEYAGSITEPGQVASSITSSRVMRGEVDVTPLYSITWNQGTLKVDFRKITLRADDASKIDDGLPLSKNTYTVTAGTVAEGHKLTATVVGTITGPGKADNVIDRNTVVITDASGNNVTRNYDITLDKGILTVIDSSKTPDPSEAIKITVSVDNLTKVYDATPLQLSNANYKVTSGSLPEGYSIVAEVDNTSIINVGKVAVHITSVKVLDKNKNDASAFFNVTTQAGSLEVTKRNLVIKTGSASKVYNGKALTEYSATADGKIAGHSVFVKFTGSQTNVGSSRNTVDEGALKVYYTLSQNGSTSEVNVTSNYNITFDYGTLTVYADGNGSNGTNGTNGTGTVVPNNKPNGANPLTGDTANPTLWISLMVAVIVIAAAAVVILIVVSKKSKKHSKGRH